MIKNPKVGLVISRCRPYLPSMNPLLIIGLAIAAAGIIAAASRSGDKNDTQQQGDDTVESQGEATVELLAEHELEEILKRPALQKHLPADVPDMGDPQQDIRDMLRKHRHALMAAMEPFAMEMSWLYKDEGNDAKAEQWRNIAKELRDFGKKKSR